MSKEIIEVCDERQYAMRTFEDECFKGRRGVEEGGIFREDKVAGAAEVAGTEVREAESTEEVCTIVRVVEVYLEVLEVGKAQGFGRQGEVVIVRDSVNVTIDEGGTLGEECDANVHGDGEVHEAESAELCPREFQR